MESTRFERVYIGGYFGIMESKKETTFLLVS